MANLSAASELIPRPESENGRIHYRDRASETRNGIVLAIPHGRAEDFRAKDCIGVENIEQVEHSLDALTLLELECLLQPQIQEIHLWVEVRARRIDRHGDRSLIQVRRSNRPIGVENVPGGASELSGASVLRALLGFEGR